MHPALLTTVPSAGHVHLIVGAPPLASARCTRTLEVGAQPVLIAPESSHLSDGLARRVDDGSVAWLRRDFRDEDLTTLGREDVDRVVDAVFVVLGRCNLSVHIATLCRRLRIPVNVTDAPDLCTFTLLSVHNDGPLQIGVTTSGNGCKLAARIRREIAAALPTDIGSAVERLGRARRRIQEEDGAAMGLDGVENGGRTPEVKMVADDDDDSVAVQPASFNRLVLPADAAATKTRRVRWLSQICEYWPLARLAAVTDADVDAILRGYTRSKSPTSTDDDISSSSPPRTPPALAPTNGHRQQPGHIILAGTGPGHPDLLTRATARALSHADLILADKLVPAPILAQIPRRARLHIARKFPGNAEAAQDELLALGLAALRRGERVVRLKQGDPYVFGRGGEEVAFFRAHAPAGCRVKVLPGVTSALAAPLAAAVPATHRGVADQLLVCTGTGRRGAAPEMPEWVASRTTVFLMALHRVGALVAALVEGRGWPREVPCAVVERATCPDQRVIRTTLKDVASAVEEEGSRPPGLLVVGWACAVLHEPSGEGRWTVEEGFREWDDLGLDGELELVDVETGGAVNGSSASSAGKGAADEAVSNGVTHASSAEVEPARRIETNGKG